MAVAPQTVDGGKGSVELRDDGVVHLRWLSGISIEVEDAKAAMAKVNEVCQGVPRPMLVDMAAASVLKRRRCSAVSTVATNSEFTARSVVSWNTSRCR